jgi:hypothetical protein
MGPSRSCRVVVAVPVAVMLLLSPLGCLGYVQPSAGAPAAAPTSSWRDFEIWAFKQGVISPKLRHASFEGGLRGLRAEENVAAGEELARLPRAMTLSLTEGEKCPPSLGLRNPDVWDRQVWYFKLALKLILELRKEGASNICGYVQMLPGPGELNTPFHWTDEELAQLQCTDLERLVRSQRVAWRKVHAELAASGCSVTLEELVWSTESIISRAFQGDFGSDQRDLWIAGVVALIGYGLVAATQEPLWALIPAAAFLPLALRAGKPPQAGPEGAYGDVVILPFMDSLNHDTRVGTNIAFDPTKQTFSVSVDRAFSAGEQAFISYGDRTNTEFLQFYGFVERDNPADAASIRLPGGASARVSRYGKIEAEPIGSSATVDIELVKRACRHEHGRMSLSDEERRTLWEGSVEGRLAVMFREERCRLLSEAMDC